PRELVQQSERRGEHAHRPRTQLLRHALRHERLAGAARHDELTAIVLAESGDTRGDGGGLMRTWLLRCHGANLTIGVPYASMSGCFGDPSSFTLKHSTPGMHIACASDHDTTLCNGFGTRPHAMTERASGCSDTATRAHSSAAMLCSPTMFTPRLCAAT